MNLKELVKIFGICKNLYMSSQFESVNEAESDTGLFKCAFVCSTTISVSVSKSTHFWYRNKQKPYVTSIYMHSPLQFLFLTC